ncbi:hypothetical protein AB9_079 [Acinetobacter phage vB_AbaM_B9]|nr:hypothetical protein AB9_079 [Acinetobacter phage vB_AbaM_B9]
MSDWNMVADCDSLFIFDSSYGDFFVIHYGGIYINKTCQKFKDDHGNKSYREIKEWTEKTFRSLSDKSTWLMCYFGECK